VLVPAAGEQTHSSLRAAASLVDPTGLEQSLLIFFSPAVGDHQP
jgi:hypothetical protein